MKKYLLLIMYILISGCENVPEAISVDIINTTGIRVKLLSEEKNANRPLVIIVPGSGGSFIPNKKFYGLVTRGYDVLSIAYFGEKNLPKKIEHVPLEYLKNVVLWSKNKFPKRKIVLLGVSKGAEYSLTFASNFDLVDGLIGYSPSAFVLPNHIGLQKNEPQKSSWSLQGKELPFAPLKTFDDEAGTVIYKKYIDPVFNNKEQIENARIKVENIKCNVLLLSGKEDLVWPASQMASLMKGKMEHSNQDYIIKHISYENCGHQFLWFNEEIPEKRTEYQSMNLTGIKKHKFLYGGSHKGTINAMVNSRIEVLNFLKNIENTHSNPSN